MWSCIGGWPASLTFSFINQLLAFHAQPQLNNSRKEDSLPRSFWLLGLGSMALPLRSAPSTNQFHFFVDCRSSPSLQPHSTLFGFIHKFNGVCLVAFVFFLRGALGWPSPPNPLKKKSHPNSISLFIQPSARTAAHQFAGLFSWAAPAPQKKQNNQFFPF